jgi:hypothetical protein
VGKNDIANTVISIIDEINRMSIHKIRFARFTLNLFLTCGTPKKEVKSEILNASIFSPKKSTKKTSASAFSLIILHMQQ